MRVGIFLSLDRINGLPRGVIKISKFSNTIEYNLRTTLDASGITQLQGQLASINSQLEQMEKKKLISSKEVYAASNDIKKLGETLSSSLNPQTGLLDLSKFQKQLNGLSLSQLEQSMSKVGVTGEVAFGNMVGQLGRMDTSFKNISSFADKIFNTMGNTVRWGITASIFQTIQNSLYRAVDYVQELDTSLNNIRIVTSASNEDMRNFALYANEAAQAIGASTTSFTDAAQLYAQNGFNEEDYTRLAEITTKVANVTQQNTTDVSEQITALMEGYHMSIDQVEESLGGMAVVAAASAADLEELATAEQKVASTANTLGVSHEQLTAQIGTIVSVTRQAPESVGNAMRTLYARIADLQMGNTLEDGVTLGNLSKSLQEIGVDVLDADGNLRNLGDVLEELQGKWQDLSDAQQIALGTQLAGKYQLNPFMALMDNAEMYNEQLEMMADSTGALDEQQSIYMDSMAAKLQSLSTAGEGLITHLFDANNFKPGVEALTDFLNLLTEIVDSLGGLSPILTGIGSIATKVFRNQLGQAVTNMMVNYSRNQSRQTLSPAQVIKTLGGVGDESKHQASVSFIEQASTYQSRMNTEQQEQYNDTLKKTVDLENQVVIAIKNQQQAREELETYVRMLNDNESNNITNVIDPSGRISESVGEYQATLTQALNGTEINSKTGKVEKIGIDKAIDNVRSRIRNLNKELKEMQDGSNKTVDAAQRFRNAISKQTKSLEIAGVNIKEINEELQLMSKTSDPKELEAYIKKIEGLLERLQNARRDLAARVEGIDERTTAVEDTKSKRTELEQSLSQQEDSNDLEAQRYARQSQIQDIIAMTSAVGQLAFAWQGFQSLGSIWSNNDLTVGEKIEQTLMNLAFIIPSIVTSVQDLQNGFKALSAMMKSSSAVAATEAAVEGTVAAAHTAAGTAATGAAVATNTLTASIKGFLSSTTGLIAIIGIFLAIGAAVGAAQQDFEDMKTSQQEAAQAAQENLDTINQQVSSFDTLYETYKQTGQVTDDLISSAQELTDSLDIQGGNALIASGNFDALAESIRNAQDAAAEDSLNKAIQAQQGYINRSIQGGWLQNGVLYDGSLGTDFNSAFIPQNTGDWDSSFYEGYRNIMGSADDSNPISYIRAANSAVEYLSDEISDLREESSKLAAEGQSTAEIDALIQTYSDQLTRIQTFLNDDTVTNLLNSLSQGAAAEIQLNQDQYSNLYGEDLYNAFTADPNSQFSQYAQQFSDWSDAISFLIQNVDDDAQKISLEALQARYQFAQEASVVDSDEAADDIYEQLNNSALSNENVVELRATFSYEELAANLDEIIERLNNGEDLEDIIVDIKPSADAESQFLREDGVYTNVRDEMDITGLQSELDLTQDEYNDYVDAISSIGELSPEGEGIQQIQEMNSELQNSIDSLEEQQKTLDVNSEEYQKLSEQIEETSQDMADNNQLLDDIRSRAIESAKGIEELAEVYDESAKSIQTADEASLEYTDSINALVPGLEHLLNIDMSGWSQSMTNSFVAENLDNIRGAIDGNVDALQRLRSAAAQQIMIQAGIDPNTDTEVWDYMSNLINWANTNLPDIQAGASIDDTYFREQLTAMVNSALAAGASIDDIMRALNGMGVEAEITYEPMEVHFPRFKTNTGNSGTDALGNIMNSASTILEDATKTVQVPTISLSDVRKVGTSNPARYSGPNYSSRGNGGGGGRSGGGGGGSGSTYEPKTKDPVEDELDRYERVNAELDTLENRLEAVAEEQDRLAGFDIADNMSKQIGLIQEQIKWEREKLKIQKEEAEEYRNQLASQYGITYDTEGHISNYAAVYKRLLNNLNGLIDQYNATTTESGQEALDKQIEAAQENFDKYNDLVEKYDELVSNSILETEKEIQDFYDQIEDLQIEAFQKAVDAVDNIKDLQESIHEFNAVFTGLDSDSPFRGMMTALDNLKSYWDVNTVAVDNYYDELIARNNEAMKNASAQRKEELQYQNQVLEAARKQYAKGTFEAGGTGLFDMEMSNLNTILEQIKQYEQTGTSTIFGENAGDMYDVANDIYEQATSLLLDYEDQLDELQDKILEGIDEIGDRMDERLEAYENINDELEHYADIIEMVQGENAYDQLNQVSQATIANNQATINELKQNIALWQDMLAAMDDSSEEWKTVNEYITDAQQELLEKTSDTVEEMLEMYERGVQNILDKWISSTGMGDDLDWIAEEWELINRNADYYLDDVNAAYEIQKLQGKYLDLLDDANGLDIQNQITQQMAQQLGYLREKDKLSEYDVQYANAQLEILQKTIALQEAQRNKSQLQLRRDNQGNYSYVYTADENDTRAAQGDLLDAQNNAYNLSKDQMQQTQADSLSALQDARDTLEQIWTNANLTLEEKTKRTQTIIDSLKEYLAGTSEQLSESEKNIINDFIGMCDILTDENDERLQDVYEQIVNGNKDAFDQIDTRWQTSITNWLQNMEDFNVATDESFQGLIDNFEDYQGQLDELGDLAGMTFDNMSNSIQNAVDKTNDLASSTSSFISQLKNDAGTVKEYEAALAEMTAKIQDAKNGMRAYQEQVNQLQQNLTAKEQENANLTSQVKDLQSQIDAMKNPSGGSDSGNGSSNGGADSNLAWGIAQAIWTYGGASGWGNDPVRSGKLTKAYGSAFARQVQSLINQYERSGKLVNYGSMKYSSYNLIGYRSGGYTGDDWSASEKANGKIGLLHEKELVLNKTDTENILNAVDMVRSMVALGRNGNYNDIIRQSNNVVDMASVVQPLDDMGQTIYQVECTFPNATNVDEIQRAILTLPDIAPQYAYKS